MALNFLLSTVHKQCLAKRVCLLHMFTPWHYLAAGLHYCSLECVWMSGLQRWVGSCVTTVSCIRSLFLYFFIYFSGVAGNGNPAYKYLSHAQYVARSLHRTYFRHHELRVRLVVVQDVQFICMSKWAVRLQIYAYVLYMYVYAWMHEAALSHTWSCCICYRQ